MIGIEDSWLAPPAPWQERHFCSNTAAPSAARAVAAARPSAAPAASSARRLANRTRFMETFSLGFVIWVRRWLGGCAGLFQPEARHGFDQLFRLQRHGFGRGRG